ARGRMLNVKENHLKIRISNHGSAALLITLALLTSSSILTIALWKNVSGISNQNIQARQKVTLENVNRSSIRVADHIFQLFDITMVSNQGVYEAENTGSNPLPLGTVFSRENQTITVSSCDPFLMNGDSQFQAGFVPQTCQTIDTNIQITGYNPTNFTVELVA